MSAPSFTSIFQKSFRTTYHRRYHRISLYIGSEFLFSFFVAFLFFFGIFFVNQLLLLAEEILAKDVGLLDVALLIIYSLPAIVSFTFPFASLVGGLMAIGRLSSDSEILAFRASGIPYRRLLYPLIVLGLAFSLFSFAMGDYFLPRGTLSFGKLYREILYSNPALELESNSVKEYQDTTLVTGEIIAGTIYDLVIMDTTDEGEKRVIMADTALLRESSSQSGVIGLTLRNVFGHAVPAKATNNYHYFEAEEMIYNILLRDISYSLGSLTPREMSSIDVYKEIRIKEAALKERIKNQALAVEQERYLLLQGYLHRVYSPASNSAPGSSSGSAQNQLEQKYSQFQQMKNREIQSKSLQIHKIELYKKMAIPFGCLAFVFFFFPAGTFSKKSGRSVGFGIGLLISVLYWAMLFAGQTLGLRMDFSPVAAMWLPNVIIVAIGIILYRARLSR
ncbi:MAG: LptF/LptG family permease [Spirochaetia bacterium]|nr:LptF/LptG family permease [Spirochaetia bacterium]